MGAKYSSIYREFRAGKLFTTASRKNFLGPGYVAGGEPGRRTLIFHYYTASVLSIPRLVSSTPTLLLPADSFFFRYLAPLWSLHVAFINC